MLFFAVVVCCSVLFCFSIVKIMYTFLMMIIVSFNVIDFGFKNTVNGRRVIFSSVKQLQQQSKGKRS